MTAAPENGSTYGAYEFIDLMLRQGDGVSLSDILSLLALVG